MKILEQIFGCLAIILFSIILPVCSCGSGGQTWIFNQIPLDRGVIGPESVTFDRHKRGPYVVVSDGRILRWEGFPSLSWTQFAVMPNWSKSCIGINDSPNERYCGRPLGLKFHPKTYELYVADAYHGLVVVDQKGGRGKSVVKGAEGIKFMFTNALDIDRKSGVIYFTDTSTKYERWEYKRSIDTGDSTGRLMVYNPHNHEVKVLLKGLSFANGVALSRNNNFLLISETTTSQIRRFWLKGPRYHTSEIFLKLEGRPDNINRDFDDNFWIAQVRMSLFPLGGLGDKGVPVKIDEQGGILERLDVGEMVLFASDIVEFNGSLWIGSVVNSYVNIAKKI